MRILHAIHDFLPRHRAGSEIYAFHLCRELAREHNVTVLCAEYDPSRPHGSIVRRTHEGIPVVEIANNWAFAHFGETYRSPGLNRSLRQVLEEVRPEVLHIHNLLNLSMDLPALARSLAIPSVATLHDYTLLCPSGGQRVHVAEQHVCHTIDPDRCTRCFPQSHFASQMTVSGVAQAAGRSKAIVRLADVIRRRVPNAFAAFERHAASRRAVSCDEITERLAYARRVFDSVDLFVAPSQALGDEYRNFGLPAHKLLVSDYGFMPLAPAPRASAERLRIGFVGTLVWHKGVHVLVEAVRGLPADRFELTLFGDMNVFPAYVQTLRDSVEGLPVRFAGGFDERTIHEVYGSIDVLVVPSLWPENSPLVIHEAFMAGVPVIGARQGGIPGLVDHEVNGLVYDAYSPDDLRAALARLIDEPSLISRFAAHLPRVKSMAQDAAEWTGVYASLTANAADVASAPGA
jgi:glycosyltransferase involved in cell wall biosynthesis